MAETCGFFNSVDSDRVYSAEHFSTLISMLFTNGTTGLGIVRSGSSQVIIRPGGAIIDGYWYYSSEDKTFNVPMSNISRWDRIVLRYTIEDRNITMVYRTGSESGPPEPDYNSSVKEIPICKLLINPGTIASIWDERSIIELRTGGT